MLKPLRVLLIEDSEDDAQLMLHALKAGGYAVESERVDTPAAMQAALTRAPWDIVLSDYRMPHFSGPAALQLLKETCRDIPFILLSGKVGEETAVDAMRAGACDFVMKDRLARLAPAVDREMREAKIHRERRRMEEQLRLEQERFRALVEKSWEMIFVTDAAGRLTYISPAQQRALGYTDEECRGSEFLAIVHPDDLAGVQGDLAEIRQQPGATRMREVRLRHKDGSWRWFDKSVTNMLADPSVHGFVINSRDITARRQAEELSHRREQEFRALVQQAPDVIAQFDRELRCLYVNRPPENAAGLPVANLGGNTGSQDSGSGAAGGPSLRQNIAQVFASGQETTLEYEIAGAHGARTYQVRIAPVLGKDGTVESVIASARDITASRQLEAEYRQAQKMEAIGQLAGGIAHDFNNILTIIQMQSSLLRTRPGLEESVNSGLQVIQEATTRASTLTRQLLTFSRRQVKQAHDINLAEVIGPMAKLLRRVLGEDVVLETEFAPNLPLINADPGMMEQVLMNMAVNARDAMSGGGRLTIGLEAVDIDAVRAALHKAAPGRYVSLRVSDTGCGIPPENLRRLFEPFFTTKEVGKGTGLGLATVFGIVQQHLGWIEVETEVGKGTTFRVFLPAIQAEGTPFRFDDLPKTIPGGTETILLVEDEETVRTLVRGMLEHYGYTVLDADCAATALKIWAEKGPGIDLLITDLIMPGGINGRQLADRLIALRPNLKVIYTSGYSSEATTQQLPLGPGRVFLHKPYPAHALALAVRRCCDTV